MVQISNITFFISNRCLFSGATTTINKGDRVGLVGPNGVGKTTLLRLITKEQAIEQGSITIPKGTTVGVLKQDILELSSESSIRAIALTAFEEANKVEQEMEEIGLRLANLEDYSSDEAHQLLERLDVLQHRFAYLEGDRKESKTDEVLEGLGFSTTQLDEPLSAFSGGWRMRVALAKLLLQKPDVLLLDEPTNHLDIDSIAWLEKWLVAYEGAVVLVSHDREFIDRMVNRIVEIRNKKLYEYTGNYEDYLLKRQEQVEQQRREYESQQKEIQDTEQFISRFRAKATKAKQVQSRVKALEKIDRIEEPEPEQDAISFSFPEPPRVGQVVIKVKNLVKTYEHPVHHTPIRVFTEGQDLEVERGDKIALIGPNGAGKSTLARIIFQNEPFDGSVEPGYNLNAAFFAQHLGDMMNSQSTILEEVEQAAQTSEARSRTRTLLGCFLFTGDDVFKPVSVLSGGERSRVALAKTLLQPANLLILDEPTNHLDLRSKQVLVDAINAFQGTVLLISHDRHFIKGCATKIWRAEGGKVTEYKGGYDYYEWKVSGETPTSAPVSTSARVQSPSTISPKEQKRLEAQLRNKIHQETQPLRKKAQKLEKEVQQLEAELATLEKEMANPDFYFQPDHSVKLAYYGKDKERLDRKSEEWLLLQDEIETMEQQLRETFEKKGFV